MVQTCEQIVEYIAFLGHHDDSTCYFCVGGEPEEADNELEDNEREDDPEYVPQDEHIDESLRPGGVVFANQSQTLGNAMMKDEQHRAHAFSGMPEGGEQPNRPPNRIVKLNNFDFETKVAAHHLIPGDASLKGCQFDKGKGGFKYIGVKGKKGGNIGYNVNSSPNGVWLPGHYAFAKGKYGPSWSQRMDDFQYAYACQAIKQWRAQFHDSHVEYSNIVQQVLNNLYDKLEYTKTVACEQKNDGAKPETLRMLVQRFHTVSARLRRMLLFPMANWFDNVYTSNFSLRYMRGEVPSDPVSMAIIPKKNKPGGKSKPNKASNQKNSKAKGGVTKSKAKLKKGKK